MSLYHVLVQQEEGWYVGRVLERAGVTTQGRTLDELVVMLRDAIELMWNERNPSPELVLSGKMTVDKGKRVKRPSRRKREAA
jgi:predicted RNase H-like HicB family nuclease